METQEDQTNNAAVVTPAAAVAPAEQVAVEATTVIAVVVTEPADATAEETTATAPTADVVPVPADAQAEGGEGVDATTVVDDQTDTVEMPEILKATVEEIAAFNGEQYSQYISAQMKYAQSISL